MERLWSPWRLPYVTGTGHADGCIFCDVRTPLPAPLSRDDQLVATRSVERAEDAVGGAVAIGCAGHVRETPWREEANHAVISHQSSVTSRQSPVSVTGQSDD